MLGSECCALEHWSCVRGSPALHTAFGLLRVLAPPSPKRHPESLRLFYDFNPFNPLHPDVAVLVACHQPYGVSMFRG